MDYLREAVKKYQPPLFKGPTLLLSDILRNVGDIDKESRRIINIIKHYCYFFGLIFCYIFFFTCLF